LCPAKIVAVKVSSPLGEYPFLFRRLERRGAGIAIVGTVAGIESSVIIGRDDLRPALKALAGPLAAAVLVIAWRRRRARSNAG
jgi:hypothetical protein